jgi:predicted nucleic acid-binding protein
VPEAAVADASPLIFLARAEHLDLLKLTGDHVVMPTAVAFEIRRRGEEDVTARALDVLPWLRTVDSPAVPPVIQAWDLGPGESAVLAWALTHRGCEAIVDDLAARRCAATLGIPVRGTLGLVLLAKQRNRIPLARPVVETLREAGMYLSDRVVDRALALVGE